MQQPSAQGIASLFRGNPEPLQQRIQQEQQAKPGLPPDLQKLLALNIVTNEKDAAAKQQAMDQLAQMQGQQGQQGQQELPTVMQTVQEQARQKMEAQQVQAQQQQQGLQALMQQSRSPQVPEGTPQPQAQPQGIDELPVDFQMAGGGIVAFQEGKRVPRIQDEPTISDEERTRLERELLMRIIGEEARNPPPQKRPPMEITESDLSSVPGLESGNLYTRALADARGPQPDNRAMPNAIERREPRAPYTGPKSESLNERAARQMEEKGSIYDKEFGIPPAERAAREARRQEVIAQIPTGGEPTVTGGKRASGSELERNILNTLAALPGAGAAKATTLGRQSLAGLAALLGMDKSSAPEKQARPQAALAQAAQQVAPSLAEESGYSREGSTGARPYTPTPKPIADLQALADQQRRQQAPRPAPVAQPPQVAPAAPMAAPQAVMPPQESLADKINSATLRRDPEAERITAEKRRLDAIGAPDTSVQDRMIAELEKRKAQLEGPQDSFGRLMEYLGQVAATPRGLSSFEAGAQGASGVRKLEQTRQLEQYNLTKQALDVSQKKLDTVRAFATDQYNVGENRFNQVYKEQFDAAKQVSNNEQEARKLAQQNTLKMLELEQGAKIDREKMQNQLKVANIGQTREYNEQARINKITSLKQQARRATDPKVAAELMAQATDLEMAVGRGGAGAAAAAGPKPMTRDQAEDNVRKDLEDFRVGPKLMSDATAALKASGIANPTTLQIKEYLVQQNMKGIDLSPGSSAATSLPSGVTVKRVGP